MRGEEEALSLWQKFAGLSWSLMLLILMAAAVGLVALYSAANGAIDPWASRHGLRVCMGLALLLIIAMIDIRFWLRSAWVIYAGGIALLLAVELFGNVGMGAQRWLDLRVMQLQPSELMKIAIVLALARYFHGATAEDVGRPGFLIIPVLAIIVPFGLILKQPDLGTGLILLMIGGAMLFVAGVRTWMFAAAGGLAAIAAPIAWSFLHDYQKARLMTFLDPEADPLGSGYHIMQSKIALGSGGISGKGFLQGTQSHLNFLPEKQTDFIFTLLAEEWGLIGGVSLLVLYAALIFWGFGIGLASHNQFGRLVAIGLSLNLFLYVFINMAMVMGMIPVVGVPLPMISYGGTAMLTVMIGFGLIMSVWVHRHIRIPRRVHFSDMWN